MHYKGLFAGKIFCLIFLPQIDADDQPELFYPHTFPELGVDIRLLFLRTAITEKTYLQERDLGPIPVKPTIRPILIGDTEAVILQRNLRTGMSNLKILAELDPALLGTACHPDINSKGGLSADATQMQEVSLLQAAECTRFSTEADPSVNMLH